MDAVDPSFPVRFQKVRDPKPLQQVVVHQPKESREPEESRLQNSSGMEKGQG